MLVSSTYSPYSANVSKNHVCKSMQWENVVMYKLVTVMYKHMLLDYNVNIHIYYGGD